MSAVFDVSRSTVSKEKNLTSEREELQLKTFTYHIDGNEEDEVQDPLLNKPGQRVLLKLTALCYTDYLRVFIDLESHRKLGC